MKVEMIKQKYLEQLLAENRSRYQQLSDQQIKTIYIWWGTPFQLWKERLFTLIDNLLETRDTEFLEELSIELNPDPMDEVLDFIREAEKRYKKLFKLRFSIGIQTFDDKILALSWRDYYFNNLIWFFRELQQIKQPNMDYNFDFIVFGWWNQMKEKNTEESSIKVWWMYQVEKNEKFVLWDKVRREFFEKLVKSHVADGYSIYTLELFPGSERYNSLKIEAWSLKRKVHPLQWNEDAIYDEFIYLSDTVERAGYHRYEASNFALRGKRSLHNMVYREMGNYLWLGINSSSYLERKLALNSNVLHQISSESSSDFIGVRFANIKHRKSYLAGEWLDQASLHPLNNEEYLIERAFLLLRTDIWLKNIQKRWSTLFVSEWKNLLAEWGKQWIVSWDKKIDHLKLTSKWLDLYNSVITDLFAKI